MKTKILFPIFILLGTSGWGQITNQSGLKVKSDQISAQYDRASLTTLMLDEESMQYNSKAKQVFKTLSIPDKYNDHNLSSRYVNSTAPDKSIVRQVISKWFNRKSDGTFDMDLIKQRGVYNATDAEVVQSQGSIRGKGVLEDAGEKLLNKSFIIIFDYKRIENMPEYYNRMDKEVDQYNRYADDYNSKKKPTDLPLKYRSYLVRNHEGYKGEVVAYIYQIDWNEAINAAFYNELWIDASDSDKEAKVKKFEEFNFPVKFIGFTKDPLSLSSTQDNSYRNNPNVKCMTCVTDDQLFQGLIDEGLGETYNFMESKFEDFNVKTAMYSTHPLTAKIGLKEGVKVDQRYFAFEFVQNKKGQAIAKRRGVVRASSKIVDNRQVATGQSKGSKFYQIAGRRLEKGMLLKQVDDKGIGITAAYGNPLLNFMGEYNVGPIIGVPGIKIFGEMFFGFTDYDTYVSDLAKQNSWDESYLLGLGFNSTLSTSLFGYSIGLSKDINFGRNFVLIPYGSYGKETVKLSKSNKIVHTAPSTGSNALYKGFAADSTLTNALNINIGCRLGMNLLHNVQILTTVGYSIKSITLGDGINTDRYLPGGIRNPSVLILNYGIRVQF